ncbi:MAG: 50S ribosomal protein L9 [Lachnospiraceae bacterium]|nr:50S ribosomal protein L9 [Lachnospiraceae bacterium]
MKVILLQDVKSLGKKGDTIEVNDGYARNYILPKKIGVEANGANMNDLKLQKANQAKVEKEQLEAAKELGAKIETITVTVGIKVGEGGRAFGAVTGKEIAKALSDQHNITVDKKKIVLSDSLKSVGSFDVPIKLHPQVTAELKVHVEPEK